MRFTSPGTIKDNLGMVHTGLREGRKLTLSYNDDRLVVEELNESVPNIPPVTVHQIIRYLGSRYAFATKQARDWREVWRTTKDDHAGHCFDEYHREGKEFQMILRHLRTDSVAGWIIGTKRNQP